MLLDIRELKIITEKKAAPYTYYTIYPIPYYTCSALMGNGLPFSGLGSSVFILTSDEIVSKL